MAADDSLGHERRQHRRLTIRLPVECSRPHAPDASIVRTVTHDISTGGVCLECDTAEFERGERLQLEMTLPAAEGVAPYPGRASCVAEVVRVERTTCVPPPALGGFRIAARFLEPLRVAY